jgi:peptidyl-dipeptidase Dcp
VILTVCLKGLRKAAMAQAKRNFNVLGVIGNTRSFGTVPDFSNDRELRAKVWSMYVRGDNENEFDNKATLVQILQLRAKKTKCLVSLLAHWNLSNKMAKTPNAQWS